MRTRHAATAGLGCALVAGTLLAGSLVANSTAAAWAAPVPAPASRAPVGTVLLANGGRGGIHLGGWAVDPDSNRVVAVRVDLDGKRVAIIAAGQASAAAARRYPAMGALHGYATVVPATAGVHTVCLSAPDAAPRGTAQTRPGALGCRYVKVQVNPVGAVAVAARPARATTITVSGWAIDPETTHQITVGISVDAHRRVMTTANLAKPGLNAGFAGIGSHHGYAKTLPVSAAAHTVCVTAYNVLQGANRNLGCRTVKAIASSVPGVARSVRAVGLAASAQVSWLPPVRTGGVPVASYLVTSIPATGVVRVAGTRLTALVSGLTADQTYQFVVRGVNSLGSATAFAPTAAVLVKPAVVPLAIAPPLISTSRYLRNLHAWDPIGNRAKTFAMGATDAVNNPAGHSYLILLQFGGQSVTGNTQSATPNSTLTYAQTVDAMSAYIDGYHSRQNSLAPVTIAFGTNNDRDVRALTGQLWATQVVNPLSTWAHRYAQITVAGANDIEPGFLGSMGQSQAWVAGYLAATTAKFVFNGSADGCGWTSANAACNNGYTAAGIHWMAGGAAPTRILALPQIYNYTQPKQWKYISLTGPVTGLAKVNFAGPLTELTACQQALSCGSLSNNNAWWALWNQLTSDARTSPASLPYGTDLRIN